MANSLLRVSRGALRFAPVLALCLTLLLGSLNASRAQTYKYVFQFGSLGTSNGLFGNPVGVAVDASGNIFVADTNNHRVEKFDSGGAFLLGIGAGYHGAAGSIGTAGSANGQFTYPEAIAVDASNNVYVADNGNNRIQKFDSSGNFLLGIGAGYNGVTGSVGTAGSVKGQFNLPRGIAIDSSGYIFVADTGNNRVEEFSSSGNYLSKFGSSGAGNGQFNAPDGVGVDASGNVFVADILNYRVQKFKNGIYQTQFGTIGSGNGQFGKGGIPGRYDGPRGVAVDASGYVFVVDYTNNRVQKFDNNGTYKTQFGASGSGDGLFNAPRGVAADASGNVFVADTGNQRIQKFNLTGAPPLPSLINLSLSLTSVIGGTQNATGTVTLSGPALTGGATITLSSSDTTAAAVPATVIVPAGFATAVFTVTSLPVTATKMPVITAAYNNATLTANLTVTPPPVTLVSLTLSPPSVIGGSQNSTGIITLAAPAPTGGATITLTSGETTVATVPASVTVSAGAKTAAFTVTSLSVTATKTSVITASASGGASLPATLTVTPLTLLNLIWQKGGDVYYWKLNKTVTVAQGYINPGGDPNWKVAACGDLTGDGKPDIILQNGGDIYYWQMSGTTITGEGYINQHGDPNWKVVACADINGDGQPDLVLQNSVTGQVYYSQMNGPKLMGGGGFLSQGVSDWRVVGMY